MKLSVSFSSKNGYAVSIQERKSNLHDLDIARTSGLPLATFEGFANWIKGINEDVQIDLSEEQARKTGLFLLVGSVSVTVPSKSLNQFCQTSYIEERGGTIDATTTVSKESIVKAWFAANCPLTWKLGE